MESQTLAGKTGFLPLPKIKGILYKYVFCTCI